MFVPFLAATALAATFAKLGAMTVQISVLTVAIQAMCAMFLALAIVVPIGVYLNLKAKT